MRVRFQELCFATAVLATTATARADDQAPAGGAPASGGAPSPAAEATGEPRVEYGIGLRLRNVRAPQGMLELFVERAPGGVSNVGLGVDLVRRRGNVELQLGLEYERIQPAEGVWIQSNTDVAAGDEADYIVGPGNNSGKRLRWFTVEFTFLNHAQLHKNVAIRYGGGAGIGIVRGELGRYDVACVGATNATPEPGCTPVELGGAGLPSPDDGPGVHAYSLPPVFPVVNAILGLQIRPTSQLTINLEGGIRTFPFFGGSVAFFFL